MGKGSVSHNSRKFHAANTDPNRSHLNRQYCDTPIKQVYYDLFGKAVERYNAKQTRGDRCIEDYYEKIRSGKQEKLFHEIILQVGNHEDTSATGDVGQQAAAILDTFMQDFERRNPNLKVFSAHLHMDEATPHLHIDFVPFTMGSKRGLDTRVSLKQALAAQGFTGGSRQDTEWNQWVQSEKEQLAAIMAVHGIEWEQKGTHEKHLSVLDYEKKVRAQEVAGLEKQLKKVSGSVVKAESRLEDIYKKEKLIEANFRKYEDGAEFQLPDPTPLMSANKYKDTKAKPLIDKLKAIIRSLVSQYFKLKDSNTRLTEQVSRQRGQLEHLTDNVMDLERKHRALNDDFGLIRKTLGEEQTEQLLQAAREKVSVQKMQNRRSQER